jgi:hypothetical protein
MHDYDSGLDMDTFSVTADFPINDVPAGQNLAAKFQPKTSGVVELTLDIPIAEMARGKVIVSIKDHAGNVTRVERTFSVAASGK